MVTLLKVPRGISSTSVVDVPDEWSAEWFRKFIRTQLGSADIRNATAGLGIVITGTSTSPATVSVTTDLQALFHQPYILAAAPSGISNGFDTYRLIASQNGVLTIADGGVRSSITIGVATNGIGNTQLRQGAATSVIGNSANTVSNVADILATVNNTALLRLGGALSFAAVPLATLATQANNTIVGNVSGGIAAPIALSQAQLTALVNTFTNTLSGSVPGSGGGTANFLRADGAWVVPAYPVSANPSAVIGLSAVNGSAATFMRSDGAPPLDQSIVPTWTGIHIFSATPVLNAGITINAAARNVASLAQATQTYGNATDNPAYNFNGAGPFTISGSLKVVGNSGFNNTAPIAKPTVSGSRAGNAALASFLTALVNYGLITDSTTV